MKKKLRQMYTFKINAIKQWHHHIINPQIYDAINILFYFIWSDLILFYFILSYLILFYLILFYFILFYLGELELLGMVGRNG